MGRLALAALVLWATPGFAQLPGAAAPDTAAEAAAEAPAKEVPTALRHPRAALEAFFARMREDKKKEAAELLDLSKLAAIAAGSRGPDLAYKLYRLIPAVGRLPKSDSADTDAAPSAGAPDPRIDFSGVPDDPNREEPWSLAEWLPNPTEAAAQIVIAPDEEGAWRFSADTVAAIDDLYEKSERRIEQLATRRDAAAPEGPSTAEPAEPTETLSVSIRRLFPESWRKTYFVLPGYQWFLLLLWLPLSRLLDLAVRVVLTWFGDRVLRRVDPDFAEAHETTEPVWRPIGQLAMAGSWVVAAVMTDLPVDVTNILLGALILVTIGAAVLAVFRLLDLAAGYLTRRAKRVDQQNFDRLFIPLANTTAKVVAVLVGLIAAVAAFDTDLPTTLIGGLGIGGIAIALASQETLSNFIGSITLLTDRPFEVGDFVKIEGVEGEIESLGFRSTRIRTGLNSQVTMPNNKLAGAVIDNWGRRKYRRYLAKLGLQYGTPPDRIEAFCEGIRELIRRHPHTRKDFYTAYFNDFGPSSLDVLVVCFFEAPDWATELRERHRLLADIVRLAESVGVEFAFPTQTLHLHRGEDPGEPPELAADDPDLAGARAAAKIAGELANYQDRPGRVKFSGPTDVS